MPRGIKKWTEELVARRIREGYGDGEGAQYKPWTSTADFSSQGRTHRAYSAKFERTIEMVSDVEWNTFVMLEFSESITEVYEGFPLPRDTTLEIAAALGIKHPYYPGTSVPAVMTVDFLAQLENDGVKRLVAVDCKRTEEAEKERAIEKLQIAHAYFAGCGISHHLVFHSTLAMQKIRNLEWFRGAIWKPGQVEPTRERLREVGKLMSFELDGTTRSMSLAAFCENFDQRHGLFPGAALRVARILLWEHTLHCDLSTPHLEQLPLNCFVCKPLRSPARRSSAS